MSAEALLAHLRTSWIGRSLRVLEVTASTIDEAWQWLRDGAPNGAVVLAECQTAGRGRRGRTWASPHGGLWVSVIVRAKIPAEAGGRLGAALALATAQSVSRETDAHVAVTWPNDLTIGGRKVGGVLVETETSGPEIVAAVLSVGLNVNLHTSELPGEVRAIATTLCEETGRTFSLCCLAARLLEALEEMWPAVMGDGRALAAAWARRDGLQGREVRVETAGNAVSGLGEGIDEWGNLRLVVNGAESVIPAGEVVLVEEAKR